MKHIVGTNTDSNWSNVRRIYRNYERNDMRILKKMFWCGRYFGVTPFSLTGKRYKAKLLTFSALLAWCCYGFFLMAPNIADSREATVSFVVADLLWDGSNVALILTCLINSNIFKIRNWKNLYRKLDHGEILLSKQNFKVTRRLAYFYWEIFLTVFVFFVIHVYDLYISIQSDKYCYVMSIVLSTIANFYGSFLLIIVCNATRIVKIRLTFLNEILLHVNRKIFLDKTAIQKLDEVIMLYRIFQSVVESFNQIFGWHIFTYISAAVICVLGAIIFGIEVEFSQEQRAFMFILLCLQITAVITLVLSCDSAEKSGKKIIKNCYLLHHQTDSKLVKKRLLQLACYGKQWRPIISAAGFYNINQHTLVTIFDAVVTYLVIVIQFSLALNKDWNVGNQNI